MSEGTSQQGQSKSGKKQGKRRRADRKAPVSSLAQVVTRRGLLAAVSLGVCGYLVSASRADVAGKYQDLGADSHIYAVPSEEQLLVFSLGYRAAFADLLFGRTMVAAGIHFSEKRVFHHLDAYLKGIIALEPKYRDVYQYADALLNLSTVEMPPENLRTAREIQEAGFKQFPHDPDLWMSAGQFMAYLAPQRLPENEDKSEWRLAGARAIQHACDIWPRHLELPDVCLAPATIMSKNGELDSGIRALERLIAIADEESVRAQAMTKLRRLSGERAARKAAENLRSLDSLRESDLPVADRLRYQLMAPPFEARACVGQESPLSSTRCATSFSARGEILAQGRE
jgi:tetratricopeptide (TPR) repeat protein